MHRKRIIHWLVLLVALVIVVPTYLSVTARHAYAASGQTYYVDSHDGSNSNSGTSPSSPWLDLTNITGHTFNPGDSISFEQGDTWTDAHPGATTKFLAPLGSGSSGSPIVITQYQGDQGTNLPKLNGNGDMATVFLENQQYFEIHNLEITNDCSGCTAAERAGVWVYAHDFVDPNGGGSTLHHIVLNQLTIDDVRGLTLASNLSKNTGGIVVNVAKVSKTPTPTQFDDVQITYNTIYNVSRNGIHFDSDWKGSVQGHACHVNPGQTMDPSTNIVVDHNIVHDVGGNGIIVGEGSGQILSNNTAYNGEQDQYNSAGIWTIDSYQAIIRNNTVHDWTFHGGTFTQEDAEAYDTDNCDIGATFEYNWSYNNQGGFLLLVQDSALTTVRFNISENDGYGDSNHPGNFLMNSANDYTGEGLLMYNNDIYMPTTSGTGLVKSQNVKYHTRPVFVNNIVDNLGTQPGVSCAIPTGSGNTAWAVAQNIFNGTNSNCPVQGSYPKSGDPLFYSAGSGSSLGPIKAYTLQTGSQAFCFGINFSGNGGIDFAGVALPAPPTPVKPIDLGALEKGAGIC